MKKIMLPEEEDDDEAKVISHFPSIESLLESEDFSKVNQSFTEVHESLEKISRGRGGMGKTAEARKAMKAIERVMDLLRDLLKLKYQMNSSSGDSSPQRKK